MSPGLSTALALVRAGELEGAERARAGLQPAERVRLEMALAYRRGDSERALELAAHLWCLFEVDPTVLAVLVQGQHAELGEAAGSLLLRTLGDAAFEPGPAWERLASAPDDLDAWRDVLCTLISRGQELEAIRGVALAFDERVGDFRVWSLLVTNLLAYRKGTALRAALVLGEQAFPGAPELHAVAAMSYLGLGELARARAEVDLIGNRSPHHPLVLAARAALERASAPPA